jgi:hypothetical protein
MKNNNNTIKKSVELMGLPSEPNKYLKSLIEQLYEDFNEDKVNSLIQSDGLPIFLQRVLISNMSSSTLIKHIINRYGFDDVENDIKWLKETMNEKNIKENCN